MAQPNVLAPIPLECEADHCADYDDDTCPNATTRCRAFLSDGIGDLFRQYGPENERLCEWWRTFEEPWASLATLIGARD